MKDVKNMSAEEMWNYAVDVQRKEIGEALESNGKWEWYSQNLGCDRYLRTVEIFRDGYMVFKGHTGKWGESTNEFFNTLEECFEFHDIVYSKNGGAA